MKARRKLLVPATVLSVTLLGLVLVGTEVAEALTSWQTFGASSAVERTHALCISDPMAPQPVNTNAERPDVLDNGCMGFYNSSYALLQSTTKKNPEKIRITVKNHADGARSFSGDWTLQCWKGDDVVLTSKWASFGPTIGADKTWIKTLSFNSNATRCWLVAGVHPEPEDAGKFTLKVQAKY